MLQLLTLRSDDCSGFLIGNIQTNSTDWVDCFERAFEGRQVSRVVFCNC